MQKLDFSLIMPCYNQEKFLNGSINKILDIFAMATLKYEIIFIDNKSTDNTVSIIKDILKKHPDWQLIQHEVNKGRGASVSEGIKASKAPIIGYIDIDLSTSPWYLLRLIYEVNNGADIATASRVYKLRPRVIFRWILSKGYNLLMRLVLNCCLQDTETGCKVFNRNRMLPILDKISEMHWFWDTEIMVYSFITGYKIVEVPSIFIREGLSTTVRIFRDTKDYFLNLIRFRQQLRKIRRDEF